MGLKRFLGAVEHSFWLYDQVLPIHFVLSAKISGSFSLSLLRQSLAQVQIQHPLLRVGIAVSETGHPEFVEQFAPVPLRLVLRENEHQWQRETNLGRLPFGQQFGSFRIEALYGPAVLTRVKHERIVGVATLGNRLSLTVSNPSTTTSEQEASASLADALELLSKAALAEAHH